MTEESNLGPSTADEAIEYLGEKYDAENDLEGPLFTRHYTNKKK
jgi:hypothetical protein